jgi:hypothetical protein
MKKIITIFIILSSISGFSQKRSTMDQVKLVLKEVIIDHDTLVFHLLIKNHSLLSYTPSYVRFLVRDRHVAARTATQEHEIYPLVKQRLVPLLAKSNIELNYVLFHFTIPKSQELVIAMKEKNGSRDLMLHIKGSRLFKMIKEQATDISNLSQ